jgi:hypothetical protein
VSPVTRFGPQCRRCHERPVWDHGLCHACWQLLHAFGHDPASYVAPDEPAPFVLLESETPEFEHALLDWLQYEG